MRASTCAIILGLLFAKASCVPHYDISWSSTSGVASAAGTTSIPWTTTGNSNVNSNAISSSAQPSWSDTTGVFRATFTWNHEGTNALPPKKAIIFEYAAVSASGDIIDYSNPLEEDVIGGPDWVYSSGDRYWVKDDPGQSFTVPLDVYSNATNMPEQAKGTNVSTFYEIGFILFILKSSSSLTSF